MPSVAEGVPTFQLSTFTLEECARMRGEFAHES
jgi:hypothetical protein